MPTIRYTRTLALPVAAWLMQGCAALPGGEGVPSETLPERPLTYTVQSGDRLGDIAVELTGKLVHWRDIAAHNGIDDPRELRAGAVLEIPSWLLPSGADGATDIAVAEPDRPPARETSVVDEASSVTITPVRVNRDFELSPMNARSERRDATVDTVRRVRVLGSYYPKGVYIAPAAHSSLLMRVAPGTVFELENERGEWYGVVTERGIGYLRRADGLVVDPSAARRTTPPSVHG